MEEIFGTGQLIDYSELAKLATRLLLDLFFTGVVTFGVYYRLYRAREFAFTYLIFNIITFSLCVLLRKVPMERRADGFFHLVTDAARPGSRYRFRLADGVLVPDPASRHQPEDVHGPSVVIDPRSYAWRQAGWRGG